MTDDCLSILTAAEILVKLCFKPATSNDIKKMNCYARFCLEIWNTTKTLLDMELRQRCHIKLKPDYSLLSIKKCSFKFKFKFWPT